MHTDTANQYRDLFIGLEAETPLLNGNHRTYINLDNAASTPPMQAVLEAVNRFLIYYSSVHRGTGFKSQLSTHAYEEARQTVMEFLGANPRTHTCIFGKNSTEAINKLARRFPFSTERNVVLTSGMEHHSNDLPWRATSRTVHIGLTPDGNLDEADFEDKLKTYASQLSLVTITGASNVTGNLNQIHDLAQKVHAAGAQIAIDCAQLAPHRQIEMRSLDDPAHLDYVVISAHKMYAPFGCGALVGRRDTFQCGEPDMTGGGTVEIVTLDDVVWAEPPDRDEAGSPNTVGAIALAAAIKQLQAVGMDKVADHEASLTAYALEGLNSIPKIRIYGNRNPDQALMRLGVIPFRVEGMSHFLVASILGYEFGIGVRSGCFCSHPYILHLLGITPQHARVVRQHILDGDKSDMPGLIRISFGLYNTRAEVDALLEALTRIVNGKYQGKYSQDIASGEFTPQGWAPDFEEYFSLPH